MKKLLFAVSLAATPVLGYEHIAQHIAVGLRTEGGKNFNICFKVNSSEDCYEDQDLTIDPLLPLEPIEDPYEKMIADIVGLITPDLYDNTTISFDDKKGADNSVIEVTVRKINKIDTPE